MRSKEQGLPGNFATRRGACVGKAGAKGDRGRGASRRRASEALRLMGQNQVDIQTAVHGREKCMLYNRVRETRKQITTDGSTQGENMGREYM
jgi:hypothetical protein